MDTNTWRTPANATMAAAETADFEAARSHARSPGIARARPRTRPSGMPATWSLRYPSAIATSSGRATAAKTRIAEAARADTASATWRVMALGSYDGPGSARKDRRARVHRPAAPRPALPLSAPARAPRSIFAPGRRRGWRTARRRRRFAHRAGAPAPRAAHRLARVLVARARRKDAQGRPRLSERSEEHTS